MKTDVFISYHTKSSLHITEAICNHLEAEKISCWYAPRNVIGNYAGCIKDAIDKCKIFILVLNGESSRSPDVLNEINLAFERVRRNESIIILPFRIDNDDIGDDAQYYLKRIHWIDAVTPPMEARIRELTDKVKICLGERSDETKENPNENYYRFSGSFLSNNRFIGRKDELGQLSDIMETNRICFIYGMGGMGKTELVKKYAFEHEKDYNLILFLKYTSNLTDLIISNKYFEINGMTRFIINGEPESDHDFCIRKLGKIKELIPENSMIIIDNFDTENDPMLEEFLNGSYRIIFTTRINYEYLGLPVLYLDTLNDKDQMSLFIQNIRRPVSEQEKESVTKLISFLNGHTLTIELVSQLISSKHIKTSKILEQIQTSGLNSMNNVKLHHGFDSSKTLYEYIRQLFKMGSLNKNERLILFSLSLLPFSGVGFESFMEWCELQDGEIIDSLIQKSWIKYNPENDTICLHPLIAEVARNESGMNTEQCGTMLFNLDKKFANSYYMKTDERTEYGEIAKALYQNIAMTEKNLRSFRLIFWIFKDLDYYSICEDLFSKATKILENENSVELAWWYWDYGDCILRTMKYDKALFYNKKASYMLEKVYPGSYDLAYVYKHEAHIYHAIYNRNPQNIEIIYHAKHLLEESERIFEQNIKNDETKWGSPCYFYARDPKKEHDSQRASRYYAQGLSYYYLGDYEQAEYYSKKSLDIFDRINGRKDADTTAPMRVLAMIYSKTKRFDESIEMEKEVIEIRGQLVEKNQFRYFEQFETLAHLYYEAGRICDAVKSLKNAAELIGRNPMYHDYLNEIKNKIEIFERSAK